MSDLNLSNASVLDQIRLAGTSDYQQRIPSATQATVQQIQKALMDPMNGDLWNQFVKNLFNLIGTQILRSKRWVNPLAKFKRVNLYRKQSIQEIGFELMKAKGFDVKAQTLFDVNAPEIKVAYHSMNRQDRYEVSINHEMLENAFLVENGLANFIAGALTAQENSDNYDEYLLMMNLISSYNENFGFYNVQVPNIASDNATQDQIKLFLEKVRALTGRWKFMSGTYNHYGVPTFTNPENTLLLTTPEVVAKIDVNVLAGAFNVSMAEIQNKIIVVDHIPIENCIAILMDEDWFVCGDNLYATRTWENPQTLVTQYYLHHWATYGASPFMNCAIFTTEPDTMIPTITFTPVEFDFGIFNPDGTKADAIVPDVTVLRGALSGTVNPPNRHVSSLFMPTVFKITALTEVNETHTTTIIDCENIDEDDIVVNDAVFGEAVSYEGGTYEFVCETIDDALTWTLDSDPVELSDYGITLSATAVDGDKITVIYTPASTTNIPINSRTYVDRMGVIHLQAAAKKTGVIVTIEAESTYDKTGIPGAMNYKKVKTFTVA